MSYSFIYWFLMLCWVLFWGAWFYRGDAWAWGQRGNSLLLFILFVLIGLKIFGSPVHG